MLQGLQVATAVEDHGEAEPDGREPLLLLCHRIPYPPNKGDKIRVWHLLQFLARRYRVYLGTFVDDPEDWVYAPVLNNLCEATCFIPLNPMYARLRSLLGLVTGAALSLPYYRSPRLQRWTAAVCAEHNVAKRVVFSSVMGQFLPRSDDARTVVDFVDVDSDKWRQYAAERRGPSAWIYARESRRLQDYEKDLAARADASLFVSRAEADFFQGIASDSGANIGFYSNGVDADYFDPEAIAAVQQDQAYPELVFTGAMDYWPNIDAVCWFADEVLPLLQQRWPDLRFTIVGGKPAPAVRSLASRPGVEVTGRVPDVRPYIARATAAVAPMRVARGIQNKVLEAMAMARPVITTSMGLEGIEAVHGNSVLLADAPGDYAGLLDGLLKGAYEAVGENARQLVLDTFSWESCLTPVAQLLNKDPMSGER